MAWTSNFNSALSRLLRPRISIVKKTNTIFTQPQRLTFIRNDENEHSIFPCPKRWPKKNLIMYPPQSPDEPRRRGVYYHHRSNVKISPKKIWYICAFLKGLSVDEALRQLQFIPKKAAVIAKEIIEEGQQLAVEKGIIEYKSNMWLGECFCTKGLVIKGLRKHARHLPGEIRAFHMHFYVALVEGPPPKHFFWPAPMSNKEKLDAYIDRLRLRRIEGSI